MTDLGGQSFTVTEKEWEGMESQPHRARSNRWNFVDLVVGRTQGASHEDQANLARLQLTTASYRHLKLAPTPRSGSARRLVGREPIMPIISSRGLFVRVVGCEDCG
jgi:hypothetical protein